jgi:hypothetical protein
VASVPAAASITVADGSGTIVTICD